jgi:hypothetical protein
MSSLALVSGNPCDTPIVSSSQSKKKIRWGVLRVAGHRCQ